MSRLSIIVPVLGDQSALDDTLVSVLENRPASCELLVVCPRHYRDPYDLEDEIKFVRVKEGCQWPAMLNYGVAQATGELVHVLMPGLQATAEWERPAVRAFHSNPRAAAVAPQVASSSGDGAGTTMGVTLTLGGQRQLLRPVDAVHGSSDGPCGPSRQAGFFRRAVLVEVGGWNEFIHPELADVELALRLCRYGYKCQFEAASKLHSPRPPEDEMAVGFRMARETEQLYRTYVTPRQRLTVLTRHPLGVIAELAAVLSKGTVFAVLAGRAAGCFGKLPGSRPALQADLRGEPSAPDARRAA